MPRYFFNLSHGRASPDDRGTDLPSKAVALAEAVRMSGELLRDADCQFLGVMDWMLQVTDEAGGTLFVLRLSLEKLTLSTEKLLNASSSNEWCASRDEDISD